MSKKFPTGMRRSVLSLTAVGALLAGASGASADTFTYTSYQALAGTSFLNTHITYTNTIPTYNTYADGAAVNEYGGMGEITLVASPANVADNLNVFCMDIYHWLASSGTSSIGPLTLAGSGVPNPTLSTAQLNQISHLVNDASAAISAAVNPSETSAALQLAIWEIEYKTDTATGLATLASGPNGPSFIPDDHSLLALAASYITALAGDGSNPAPNNIALLTTTGALANQQDLVYIADCGPTGCGLIGQSPLPGALPLLASGLGAFGLLGWRRKKRKAVAAA